MPDFTYRFPVVKAERFVRNDPETHARIAAMKDDLGIEDSTTIPINDDAYYLVYKGHIVTIEDGGWVVDIGNDCVDLYTDERFCKTFLEYKKE